MASATPDDPGSVSIAELVTAYWRYYELAKSQNREDRLAAEGHAWAYEEVRMRVAGPRSDVISVFEALANAADDDAALAYLGAGPVEDLVTWHGAAWVDQIDQLATRNERFKLAVRCVWYGDEVDKEIVRRLRRFGPPL